VKRRFDLPLRVGGNATLQQIAELFATGSSLRLLMTGVEL